MEDLSTIWNGIRTRILARPVTWFFIGIGTGLLLGKVL